MWYQQYLEGDTHGWHIHGNHFTGVYYLEFPDGCSQTEVVSPYSFKVKKIDKIKELIKDENPMYSALILSTTFLWINYAHMATQDMVFSSLVSLSK